MSTDKKRPSSDAEVQVDPSSFAPPLSWQATGNRGTPPSPPPQRWLLPCLGVLVVGVVVQSTGWWEGYAFRLARQYLENREASVGNRYLKEGGAIAVFTHHDLNNDGFLSLEEFAPLAQRILTLNDTFSYDRNISVEEEIVTVDVKFQPLRQETMTKDFKAGRLESLNGLMNWQTSSKPWQNFGVRDFHAFLPNDQIDSSSLGTVYWMIEGSKERGPSLANDRYIPPALDSEADVMVHRLLSLFHPLPFVHMRFAPKGSTAVVRAYNDQFVEIVFRIHAEFQLNLPPYLPFWFTPAQFTGHVTLSRDAKHLVDFHLYVPNDKRLNVDMEWLTNQKDAGSMEVDIGHMPQMELSSTRDSIPAVERGEDQRDMFISPDVEQTKHSIVWTEEIPVEEAWRRLEVAMYPFKEVKYYNFTEGLIEASRLNRPIHSILLWGCLDDQSC